MIIKKDLYVCMCIWWYDDDDEEMKLSIRVLETVAAFVAAEKLVGETNVTAHAANGLKVDHGWEEEREKERGIFW